MKTRVSLKYFVNDCRGIRKIAPQKITVQKIAHEKIESRKIAPYENTPLWIFPPMKAPPCEITPQKFALEKIAPYENLPHEIFSPLINHTNERKNKITKVFALKKAVQLNILIKITKVFFDTHMISQKHWA